MKNKFKTMTYLLLILLLVFGCNDTQTNDELCYTDINSLPEIGGITTCGENDILLNLNDGDWNCCETTEDEMILEQMALHSACPNPFFSSTTTIDFSVNISRHIYLRIVNNQGEVIDTLINQFHLSGPPLLHWHPSDELEHGIYRVLLSVDNSEEILCYGDICYCVDLSNQECDDLCGTTGAGDE